MFLKHIILFFFIGVNLMPTSVVCGSRKKGLSVRTPNMLCDDFKVLNNIFWWYDWELDLSTSYHPFVTELCPPSNDDYMPEYVPMIWYYDNKTLINISEDAQFVLTFNEPDSFDQSNMTPQQAADDWPKLERRSNGKRLVSPATASKPDWYTDFFRLCNNCRVDYIATHAYFCNVTEAMEYLENLYLSYGKKIWVTEFGCPYNLDENKQLNFMQSILPELEAADYIYRYSWFMARITEDVMEGFTGPPASLFHSNSSTLTPLGEFYNKF